MTTIGADRAWTSLVLRASLGLIYCVVGMDKLVHVGVAQYADRLSAAVTFLPAWILWASGMAIPFLQLAVGALLLIGWCTRPTLRTLAGILVIQTIVTGLTGAALSQSINSLVNSYILSRAALLLLLLLLPAQADRYSLDALLARSPRDTTGGSRMDRAFAVFVARTLLGAVFLFAGIQKVFTVGPIAHAMTLFIEPYAETILPVWGLWASGVTIPYFELILGALVLVGLGTRPAVCLFGAELLFVTFGHFVNAPTYVLNINILPRMALVLFILFMSREDDIFSIDRLFRRPSAVQAPAVSVAR